MLHGKIQNSRANPPSKSPQLLPRQSLLTGPGPASDHSGKVHGHKTIEYSPQKLSNKVSKRPLSFHDSLGVESDERPSKMRRLEQSDMPWYEPEEAPTSRRDANMRETRKLLEIYDRDIDRAKLLINIAPRAPPGVPSAQWEQILRGEPVDLEQFHFLSCLHGGKRPVTTASDWYVTWSLASEATAFAFPHRAKELRAYGDHIVREFGIRPTRLHSKIILSDVATRNIVEGGQRTLLTDTVPGSLI